MDNKKLIKNSFIWTFVFGLIAHGYVYLNTTYNHDGSMMYLSDDEWKISIGRYMEVVYRIFRTRYSVPWLNGVLTLTFISLITYLIVKMFNISKTIFVVLVSACVATNFSLTFINALCIHESDSYMLGLLLYVLAAVILCIKTEQCNSEAFSFGRCCKLILASACMGMGMGFYQAYLTLPFALVAITICFECFENEDVKVSLAKFVETIIVYAGGTVIYFVGLKICCAVSGVALYEGGYNSIKNGFSLEGWDIIGGFINAYKFFWVHYFKTSSLNYRVRIFANAIIIISIVVLSIVIIVRKKVTILHSIIIGFVIVIMPGILGAMYILSDVRNMMMSQYMVPYIFAIVLVNYLGDCCVIKTGIHIKNYKGIDVTKAITVVLVVMISIETYYSIAFANAYYLNQELSYQTTREYMSNIINDIEKIDGYVPGETEVIFVGTPSSSGLVGDRLGYKEFNVPTIHESYDFAYSITGYYAYTWFVNWVMCENMYIAPETEALEYAAREDVKALPLYPQSGSIVIIDGKVIARVGLW